MDFNKVIKQRASIRNYSDKEITDAQITEIIESACLAPSPGNLSILKFIIVKDKEKIAKIAGACRQEFIKKSPVLIIVCSDSENVNRMYDDRTEKYVRQHAGAVIENFLLKITDMKLASCWIGAFSDVTVKNILKIPEEIEVEAILPIAHQSKTDDTKQKSKPSLMNLLYFEEWKNKKQKEERRIGSH